MFIDAFLCLESVRKPADVSDAFFFIGSFKELPGTDLVLTAPFR